jgi:uncharacterized membrane protein (DUF373 family)
MLIKQELKEAGEQFRLLSLYQRFEHVVVTILTALIAIIVVVAVWNLSVKILFGLVLSGSLDPSDYSIFQAVFGMIFTVIIALEFKKSLLVIAERRDNVVQIRSVVMIALLAICRKVIILDLRETDTSQVFALATAILALGVVYWLIRDSDQRSSRQPEGTKRQVHRLPRKTGSFSSAARLTPGSTMSPLGSSNLRLRKGMAMRWPPTPVKSPTARTT